MRPVLLTATLMASLAGGATTFATGSAAYHPIEMTSAASSSDVSVMSYNVKGLPWPIAFGRTEALEAMGNRLAQMRRAGVQPHIVMLQEAFTDDAKAIAAEGGYRYAVDGPAGGDSGQAPSSRADAFADNASFWKGETEGKWEDSGLRILSDYPIVATRRMAFPANACAGFDCLANKGVLIAWIKLPGIARPIAFADTHLNSGRSSGVNLSRANAAFAQQVADVRGFVAANMGDSDAAFFAGDFNVGKNPLRQRLIFNAPILPGAQEAVEQAAAEHITAPSDGASANVLLKKHKDFLFTRSGTNAKLTLSRLSIPFGFEPDGVGLSDHMGYVAHFRIAPAR